MAILRATCILIAFAFLLPNAAASHCTTWSTSDPEVAIAGWYVDNDLCQPECIFSTWIYMETNGYEGLQRVDEVVDDTCHGMIEGDVWDL